MSQKICGIPFSEITLHPDIYGGDNLVVVPCCSAWLKPPYSKFIYPVNESKDHKIDIMGAWNSDAIKEFRASILDGSYKYCRLDTCPNWISNKLEPVPPEALPYIEKKETHLDYTPRLIKACIDMACNLSCPSCRLERKPLSDPRTYERTISLFSSGVKNIYINGSGEVFINRYLMRALQEFSCEKFPDIEGFFLITNGTAFTRTNWYTVSPDFKKLIKDTWISIDSPNPDTYKKLRRDSDFSIIRRNLEFITQLRVSGELKKLTLTFVYQKYNVHEICDFIEFAHEIKADTIVINKIQHWGHQSILYFERNMDLPNDWKTIYSYELTKAKDLLKKYKIELISNVINLD
jgi:wyosine [tRNA(Phe)-imidazoG37] synthetase (radical SAM superfamily)